jgi:RecA-family ATPase
MTVEPEASTNGKVPTAKLRRIETYDMLLNDPPPLEWLVDGVVARGLLSMIVGREKTGKSMLSMALVLRMVAGGGEVAGIACYPGRVLIVDAENSQSEIHRRLHGMWHAMAIPVANHDQLQIVEARGFDFRRDLAELEAALWEFKPDLVVLDAFRALWGGKEADSDDVAAALDPLRQLLHDHDVGGLLSHHSRKTDDEYRGGTGIGASVEHIVSLRRESDDPDRSRRRLANPASRFAAEFEPLWLSIGGGDDARRISSTEAYKPTPSAAKRDEVAAEIRQFVLSSPLKEEGQGQTLSELARGIGHDPADKTVRKALQKLEDDGVLQRGEDKRYRRAPTLFDDDPNQEE